MSRCSVFAHSPGNTQLSGSGRGGTLDFCIEDFFSLAQQLIYICGGWVGVCVGVYALECENSNSNLHFFS